MLVFVNVEVPLDISLEDAMKYYNCMVHAIGDSCKGVSDILYLDAFSSGVDYRIIYNVTESNGRVVLKLKKKPYLTETVIFTCSPEYLLHLGMYFCHMVNNFSLYKEVLKDSKGVILGYFYGEEFTQVVFKKELEGYCLDFQEVDM